MKRFFLLLAALTVVCLIAVYVFIPAKIVISTSVKIEVNRNALYRKVANLPSWKEWWPGKIDDSGLYLDGIKFRTSEVQTLSVPLTIDEKEMKASADITFIPLSVDSTTTHIETTISLSNNPLKRIKTWYKSKKLDDSFSKILESLRNTYSKTVNVYDFDIQKRLVVDSILIFTSEEIKGYPSVEKVYALVDRLRAYVKSKSAKETGFPMQNIYTADSINYMLKVAIPVDQRLPDSGNIHYKWMLGGGNILITEVKGGAAQINNAYKQITNYISDYGRTAPAISFESLVTDRRAEPDSAKWITRIYYPVI